MDSRQPHPAQQAPTNPETLSDQSLGLGPRSSLDRILKAAALYASTSLAWREIRTLAEQRDSNDLVEMPLESGTDHRQTNRYNGTGTNLLDLQTTAELKNWLDLVLANGEHREIFTSEGVHSLHSLPAQDRNELVAYIGDRYLTARKLCRLSDSDAILAPRRALDLCLSLFADPYSHLSKKQTELNQSGAKALDQYYSELQTKLHFGDRSYGILQVSELVARLQDELKHHLQLIENLDQLTRACLLNPISPIERWTQWAAQLSATVFDRAARRTQSHHSFEALTKEYVQKLAVDPPHDRLAYLETAPFDAAQFDAPIIVTGSFPQGRSFFRGDSTSAAQLEQIGVGDVDLVPPSPVSALWSERSLKNSCRWSESLIGGTQFCTFAGDPGQRIIHEGPDNGIWLYRTISPIALHVFPNRVDLVIYQIGVPGMSANKPLVLALGI